MRKNNKNILLITELLSGQLLHDFANSMNGITFGLEELEAHDKAKISTHKEALSMLRESFNDLMNKHKIMKQAYSLSADNYKFDLTKSNIENYLLKKKIKFTWKIDKCPIKIGENLTEKINKITSSMVLTIASSVAGVKSISILLGKIENKILLTIKIISKYKLINKFLANKLIKKDNISLNTKNINIYITSLLLECYNTEIHCSCKNNLLEISLVLI